jgi:hypothetical protein
VKCVWNKEKKHVFTPFLYANSEKVKDPMGELDSFFRGAFEIKLESVSKSKKGKWYLNVVLKRCYVHKKKWLPSKNYV